LKKKIIQGDGKAAKDRRPIEKSKGKTPRTAKKIFEKISKKRYICPQS
jgi:hypothetical protein